MTEYYANNLSDSNEFQDLVQYVMKKYGLIIQCCCSKKWQYEVGESLGGIEIKYDKVSMATGNLYIEIAEKSNEDNEGYVPSGIYRKDNTWLWIIGCEKVFIFSKRHLIRYYEKYKDIQNTTNDNYIVKVIKPTSIGWLLKPDKQIELMLCEPITLKTTGIPLKIVP